MPKRSGYIFDGWYTAPDGGTKVTENAIVSTTESITLFAHWRTPNTLTTSTVTKDGESYIVSTQLSDTEDSCNIIVAGYKNKMLIGIKITPYESSVSTCTIDGDIDKIKVMVWDEDLLLEQLCDVEEIPSDEWIVK